MKRGINYGSSPLLTSAVPVWRSRLIVAGFALAFIGLAGRAAYVQVLGNDFYQHQGEIRFKRTLELPANRGRILDRNGLILATSVVAQSVWAIPENLDRNHPKLPEMARLLDMPLPELHRRLDSHPTFVWIRRQVDEPVALQIRELGIRGVHFRKEYKRQYPEGAAVAHVVGFTNVEDVGQEGIERAFNDSLSGRSGSRRVIRDRLGRVIEDVREVIPPVDGQDIHLSIDSRIQFFAFERLRQAVREHNARGGGILVLDTITGEVLAMANYPSFDPNNRRNLTGEQLRNRILTDTFEPGSTVKPFIAALALDRGVVRPETIVDTGNGRMTMGGFTISDVRPLGAVTVNELMMRSSNVGTVRLAQMMPARDMWETYTLLGYGQRPQVPFPGAVPGRLRGYQTWRPIEHATMSYGYGLSTSLFQIAQSYTVFSRDGEMVPVTLLRTKGKAKGVPVFSEASALAVRQMLAMSTGPGGTGQRAQTLGYSVGGKTGTTRVQEGRGYAANRHRSFFVGLAPIDTPRIVVAVLIDEPSNGHFFGGVVAAPVFSDTVQQTLRIMGVKPDMTVRPHIVATAVEETL